jgi:hypothetical protein
VSVQQHQTSSPEQHAGGHHPGGDDHHEEPAEETLAPDESPTPLWLPVLGAVLFFLAFILVAAS